LDLVSSSPVAAFSNVLSSTKFNAGPFARRAVFGPNIEPGPSREDLPASEIALSVNGIAPHGTRLIEHVSISPEPDPSTYLFTKTDLQRNLFRIPLH
jgi:hypothetical protein